VVIPTHNRAPIVERGLRSVLAQSVPPLEVIVVDDASTDDTAGRLQPYLGERVRILRVPARGGGSRARNLGIDAARGDWVAFLDSDDEWRPTKLERQLARLNAPDGPDLSVVYCRRVMHDHLGEREIPVRSPLREGDVFRDLVTGWEISTSQVMVRRTALSQVGGFDPALPGSQDYDLWLRLAVAGHRFGGVPEALTVKHSHLVLQMSGDPGLKERGLAILEQKWRPTIVERFGEPTYARWVALRRVVIAHSYLMQVREAVASGRRRQGWGHCRAMFRAGPFPPSFTARALALVGLGWRRYRGLARAWQLLRGVTPGGRRGPS
jgi:glycosyltransferase involved in cell wall biosynthesis